MPIIESKCFFFFMKITIGYLCQHFWQGFLKKLFAYTKIFPEILKKFRESLDIFFQFKTTAICCKNTTNFTFSQQCDEVTVFFFNYKDYGWYTHLPPLP